MREMGGGWVGGRYEVREWAERWGRGGGRGEKDYLCIQEHCAVVSTAVDKDTKETANVGNRRLSRQ